jgi:Domain of unknown function (DUF4326)
MTTVISVRGRDREALLDDPTFVYVGRRCAGWRSSIWGNPYRHKKGEDPAVAVEAFRQYITALLAMDPDKPKDPRHPERDTLERALAVGIREGLPKLIGKTLGCWCGDWRPGQPEIPCHAVVLARLADALEVVSRED